MKNGWVRKVGQVGRQVSFGLEGSKSTTIDQRKAIYRDTWAAKKKQKETKQDNKYKEERKRQRPT